VALNIALLSWKQSAFVFLLGTYAILTRSDIPSATGLQLDVFRLQVQPVNLQIFLVSHFNSGSSCSDGGGGRSNKK
jgi:hypothetical protein